MAVVTEAKQGWITSKGLLFSLVILAASLFIIHQHFTDGSQSTTERFNVYIKQLRHLYLTDTTTPKSIPESTTSVNIKTTTTLKIKTIASTTAPSTTTTTTTEPLLETKKMEAAETSKNGKCALLFFGLVKHFSDIVLPSIQKYILANNPECDIYAHTYDLKSVSNTRNGEKNSPIHAEDIRLLTNNTVFDTNESVGKVRDFAHYRKMFPKPSSGWAYPTSMDNMIKQWHSINAAWELMDKSKHYDRVGLFRSDVLYKTPINISDGDAVIPNFQHWGGLNDRLFYGLYNNSKIWATGRFPNAEEFDKASKKKKPSGLHSERYLKWLLTSKYHMTIEFKDICFSRVRATGGIKKEKTCGRKKRSLLEYYRRKRFWSFFNIL